MRLTKYVVFAAGVLAIMGVAGAQARTSIYSMSCERAQAYIKQRGAAVVDTGPNTFFRIVANRSYCQPGERLRRYYSKTSDNPKCNVGFECRVPILRPTGQ